jgi:hypothetical protein
MRRTAWRFGPLRIRAAASHAFEARYKAALVAATHCDQHLGAASQIGCKLLGPGGQEIDADLTHYVDDYGMDVGAGWVPPETAAACCGSAYWLENAADIC